MNKQEDTAKEVLEQGKEILTKANKRHIIIRKANGEKLVDVTFTVAVVVALILLWFQPIGIIIGLAAFAYGYYNKMTVEVLRELGGTDNVIEMRFPNEDK